MRPIVLIVGGLVTWRVTNILVKQNGPLAVFARLRAYLASKQKRIGGFYDMFSCIACMSMIVGAVAAVVPSRSVFQWIAYTLSFSAISALVGAYIAKES